MKKWYLKLNADNVIQDIIEYAYEGYIELEKEISSLPIGINGGWWKLIENEFVEDLTLKPIQPETEIEMLKKQLLAQSERFTQMEQDSMAFQDFIFETIGGM